MSVFNFDGYSEFCEWCKTNSYDPDTQYDLESEPHKRNTYDTFYIKSLEVDSYMLVWVETSYDNGWLEGEIELLPLTRKVEKVMTEKVSYV